LPDWWIRKPDFEQLTVKLLVDIGNTSLKWALSDGDGLGPMSAARHFGALPIDVLAAWEAVESVDTLLLASVGPSDVAAAVRAAAASYWQCPVEQIETSAQAHGVRIAYAEPSRLGVDRFLALIGARWLMQQGSDSDAVEGASVQTATLIVDAGTAITIDGLLPDGTHLGGQILPGIPTLRASLLQNTQLPAHHTQDHDQPWGDDTGPAIAAASLQAPAALGERLLQALHEQCGHPPRLILTGGDAERLAPHFYSSHEHQADLVLVGLARFAGGA
jgi:type III pantothenate kinase